MPAVDPEPVVPGGVPSRAGDLIAGPLRRRLAGTCVGEPEVTVSALGGEAVAIGAVRRALERATTGLCPDGLPI